MSARAFALVVGLLLQSSGHISEQGVFDDAGIGVDSILSADLSRVDGVASLDGSIAVLKGSQTGRAYVYLRAIRQVCAIGDAPTTGLARSLLGIHSEGGLARTAALHETSVAREIAGAVHPNGSGHPGCWFSSRDPSFANFTILAGEDANLTATTQIGTHVVGPFRINRAFRSNALRIDAWVGAITAAHPDLKPRALGRDVALLEMGAGSFVLASSSATTSVSVVRLLDYEPAVNRAATWSRSHRALFSKDPAKITGAGEYVELLERMSLGQEFRTPEFDYAI